MDFLPLAIPDVMLIKHRLYTDERGSFMELFRQQDFTARCGEMNFVQDNLSRSCQGTLRGLHYQIVRPQGKLVQVISGTIFDVAVDFARVVKVKPGEQHPHLLRWRAAMAGRPSMSL